MLPNYSIDGLCISCHLAIRDDVYPAWTLKTYDVCIIFVNMVPDDSTDGLCTFVYPVNWQFVLMCILSRHSRYTRCAHPVY